MKEKSYVLHVEACVGFEDMETVLGEFKDVMSDFPGLI